MKTILYIVLFLISLTALIGSVAMLIEKKTFVVWLGILAVISLVASIFLTVEIARNTESDTSWQEEKLRQAQEQGQISLQWELTSHEWTRYVEYQNQQNKSILIGLLLLPFVAYGLIRLIELFTHLGNWGAVVPTALVVLCYWFALSSYVSNQEKRRKQLASPPRVWISPNSVWVGSQMQDYQAPNYQLHSIEKVADTQPELYRMTIRSDYDYVILIPVSEKHSEQVRQWVNTLQP
jgi:hypothetical protein